MAIVERDGLTTHVDGAGEDRAKSVASNFNNHFFSSKLLICFGFRCAVNPMTFWLRRSTKDAFRLFVSGGNQVLTGQHRMRLTPDPDRGTNTKITFAIVGPLVQSYKWTTTNWPFERYGPRSPTHLDGYGT